MIINYNCELRYKLKGMCVIKSNLPYIVFFFSHIVASATSGSTYN